MTTFSVDLVEIARNVLNIKTEFQIVLFKLETRKILTFNFFEYL
jgi:hypothetical protein